MTDFVGRVDSVFSRNYTAAVETAAPPGASTLTVTDGTDLDEIGQLLTPWDGTIYNYEYDGDVTVTLAAPLTSDAAQGETLIVWDPAKAAPVVETVAHVVPLGDGVTEDVVEARVSYPLIPLLGEGIRDDETAEAVTVREDDDAYVVAEVLGQAASLTDEFVNDVLVPQLPPLGGNEPDGLEPSANPTITLRPGIGSLFVVWEPVENADPVTYDVYAAPAADAAQLAYPPLETAKVGEADGTAASFRALADGTVLSPDDSYAVAVYARDADGTCTEDAVVATGSPAKVTSEDIAVGAITAGHLTANDALFQALQAEDIEGVNIRGASIIGAEIQTAQSGHRWRMGTPGVGNAGMSIEAIPEFVTGPVAQPARLRNVAVEEPDLAVGIGIELTSGAIAPGEPLSGLSTTSIRERTGMDTSFPWGPTRSTTKLSGHDVLVEGHAPSSGAPASNLVFDAKGAAGSAEVHAEHIELTTYVYDGDDSITLQTGELELSGEHGVTINGPLEVNGPYQHTGTNLDFAYVDLTPGANSVMSGNSPGTKLSAWTTNSAQGFSLAGSVVTCHVAGRYLLTAYVSFPAGPTSAPAHQRGIAVYKNGAQFRHGFMFSPGDNTFTSGARILPNSHGAAVNFGVTLAVGDTIEVAASQNSGSTASTNGGWLTLDRVDK